MLPICLDDSVACRTPKDNTIGSRPRKITVWRVQKEDNTWRTYNIHDFRNDWLLREQGNVEGDEGVDICQGAFLYAKRLQAEVPASSIMESPKVIRSGYMRALL